MDQRGKPRLFYQPRRSSRRFHSFCSRVIKRWIFFVSKIKKIEHSFFNVLQIPETHRFVVRRTAIVALSGIFVTFFIFQLYRTNIGSVFTATYTFVQDSWSGGVDTVAVAVHPDNQSGWNKYYAASSTINFANTSALTLTTSTYSFTDDATTSTTAVAPVSGGGFANGTTNNTQYVAGSNPSANISLASTVVNKNIWDTQLQGAPGAIGSNGRNTYATGTYIYVFQLNSTANFLRYDTQNDTWTNFTQLPGNLPGSGAAITSDNTYLYVIPATAIDGVVYRHLLSNTSSPWDAFSTTGGPAAAGNKSGIKVDANYVYVEAGGDPVIYRHTVANTSTAWEGYTAAPETPQGSASMDIDANYIYLSAGSSIGTVVWRHPISSISGSWDSFVSLEGVSGDKIKINGAYLYEMDSYGVFNQFGRHILTDTSSPWEVFTNPPALSADFVFDSTYIYMLRGNNQTGFYRHVISNTSSAWTTVTALPAAVQTYGEIAVLNNNIYVVRGATTNNIFKHTTADTTSAWQSSVSSTYPSLPGNVAAGGSIAVDANYLYVAQGNNTKNIYRHTLLNTTDPWDTFAATPANIGTGSNLVFDSNFLYLPQGGSGFGFYRHTLANTSASWESFPGTASVALGGGAAVNSQYLYVLSGGLSANFWRHTVSDTSSAWDAYPIPLAGNYSNRKVMADENYIYAAPGNNSKQIFRHTAADSSSPWDNFASTSVAWGGNEGGNLGLDSNYLYASYMTGGVPYFLRHTLTNTSTAWDSFSTTNLPTFGNGSGLTIDGTYMYLTQGNGGTGFFRHAVGNTSTAWTVMPTVPGAVQVGGNLAEDANGNNLYLLQGNTTPNVYRFIVNQTTYSVSGDWTSAAINVQGQRLNSMSWTSSTPSAAGANAVRLQIATSSDNISWSSFVGPDGTNGTYFTSSPATLTGSLTAGAAYFKYKVYLQTANTAFTPSLSDLTLNYDQYNPAGTLVSSVYDSGDANNVMGDIQWNGSTPGGGETSLSFQLRTGQSSSTLLANPWVGPDGTANTWFTTAAGNTLPASIKDSTDDRYFQYRAVLSTTNGVYTPVLTSVTSTYVVNAPPEIQNVTAIQNSDGTVTIGYQIRDPDTANDTGSVGVLTPTFLYCPNGTACSTISALTAGATSTKAVDGVTWTSYSTTWTPTSDTNGVWDTGAKIKVTVNDLQGANNLASATSSAFTLDTMAPPSTSLRIDATSTPATLFFTATDTSTPITMRYATSFGALTAASYGALTSATTLSLSDPGTVYVQYKDAFGNASTPILVTTPNTPQSLMVQDTSNFKVTPHDYRLFLAWKVVSVPPQGSFGGYRIYRATASGGPYTLLYTEPTIGNNFYTDSSSVADTLYYYKIVSVDSLGNTSFNSTVINAMANGVQDYGEGGGGVAGAPVISNVASSNISGTSALITWDTDTLANSTVGYSTTPANFSGGIVSSASMVNNGAGIGQHSILLSNLTPGTTYYFQVSSANNQGNTASDSNGGNGFTFTTTNGPTITNVSAPTIDNTSALITWTTDIAASSKVYYATSTSFVAALNTADVSLVTSHSVSLTSLSTSTKYYYYVESTGGGGTSEDRNVVGGIPQYYNFNTTNDVAVPVFTNFIATPATSSVIITWTTSKPADSQLEYGATVSYGLQNTLDTTLTVQHSMTITGLTPSTQYHYRGHSVDANGNRGTSSDQSFTTLSMPDTSPVVISNVATSSISLTQATISWATNKNTNGTVDYGTTPQFGSLAGNLYDYSTSTHTVTLTGLQGNTLYYFRANSLDVNGLSATSAPYTFVTQADITPPVITASSTLVNDTAAFINWTTNENAIAEVDYGTASDNLATSVAATSTFTTNHSLPLTGLSPETTYYYQIVTADPSANTTTAGPFALTTSKYGASTQPVTPTAPLASSYTPPPNNVPTISAITVSNITPFGATITWTTDMDASSLVKYGGTNTYSSLAGDEENLTTDHSVVLVNLQPARLYHFVVKSQSAGGRWTASSDNTFVTLNADGTVATSTAVGSPANDLAVQTRLASASDIQQILEALLANPYLKDVPESVFAKVFKDLSQNILNAPTIVGLRPVVDVHGNAATIRWSTDKKTTGLVSFARDLDYKPTTDKPYTTTVVDSSNDSVSTIHQVDLTNLDPGTLYHFQAASKGEIGPEGKSKDYTFQTEAILPIVFDAKVDNVTESNVTISWKTNVPTNATIEYTNTKTDVTLTAGDTSYVTSHGFTINGLDSGAPYTLVIKAKNETGNEAISPLLHFETIIDLLPPKILNLTSNSTLYPGQNSKVQTIISWDTDKPSTAQVFAQEGVGLSTSTAFASPLDTNFNIKHIIVLTNFRPGTVYKYWVESTSTAGNHIRSDIFSVLTPIERQTIIDIIGHNFQSVFGWTKNLGL